MSAVAGAEIMGAENSGAPVPLPGPRARSVVRPSRSLLSSLPLSRFPRPFDDSAPPLGYEVRALVDGGSDFAVGLIAPPT